jgi:apolipoprotein D and lipocalin family protein
MTNIGFAALAVFSVSVLAGCATIPDGVSPVDNFDKARYLGKWYEIARYDFVFERNLNNTSAEYDLRADGYIGVTNRGYNYKTNRWSETKGRAKFRGSDTAAALEVSFFGPFYAAYNVIALDEAYRYALVAGNSTKYLWILSREQTIPDDIKERFLQTAEAAGYDLGKLIWVEHDGLGE